MAKFVAYLRWESGGGRVMALGVRCLDSSSGVGGGKEKRLF